MKAGCLKQWIAGLAAMATPVLAIAQSVDPQRWQLNMGRGVTHLSNNAYEAHMLALWICVAIGLAVFIGMGVAIVKFRKSKGAVADTGFTHNTRLEIMLTMNPMCQLVSIAC